MFNRLTSTLLVLCLLPFVAEARLKPQAPEALNPAAVFEVAQRGMSLNDAIQSVRNRSDVERVLSAETKVQNGREVHHIKVMTKDGTVRTIRVNGRQR